MGKGKRQELLAGEAFLRQDEGLEAAPRLGLVTCGEDLARLLDGAMACNFSHEEPTADADAAEEENALVARFLRDCLEFCDVPGLPESLREEMEAYFGQKLDALWRKDWLVFGAAEEAVLEPGDEPLTGRAVTLCLARADSPSVEMDARLRRSLEYFKEAISRVTHPSPDEDDGDSGLGSGGLLH